MEDVKDCSNDNDNTSNSSIVSSMIDLVVKTIANDSLQFLISSSSNISELKSRVKESTSEKIAENRQRIIYRGQVLDDNCTLMSYGISAGAVLHMVARPENFEELRRPIPSSIESETISSDTNIVNDLLSVLRSRSSISNASTIFEGLNSNNSNNYNNLEGEGNRNSITNMSLEHTRQGILTINTILSSFRQNEEGILLSPTSSSSSLSNSDNNINNMNQRKHYYVGQWVDVKDTVAQWLEATVMALNEENQTIFIHYNGWPTRWDEWIDMDSPRVAPFRTRTAHSPLLPHLSPAPSVLLNNAPRTGSDDLRLLLPQISQLLHKILPAIDEAANLCSTSINDSNIHNYYTRAGNSQENPTISPNMPWPNEPSNYERRRSGSSELSDSERQLNLLSSELSPIFDRLGRVMTDLSPHLRELRNRSAPAPQPQVYPENTFSSLLRTRAPSPPPENRFRELISTSRTNAGSIGRAGAFPGNHLDIHIAILSPSHHNAENSISQTVANLAASLQLQGRVNQRESPVEELRSISSSEHESLSVSTPIADHQEGRLNSFTENSDLQLNSIETESEQSMKHNNNDDEYNYDKDNDNDNYKNDNDNDNNTKDIKDSEKANSNSNLISPVQDNDSSPRRVSFLQRLRNPFSSRKN